VGECITFPLGGFIIGSLLSPFALDSGFYGSFARAQVPLYLSQLAVKKGFLQRMPNSFDLIFNSSRKNS
jgi:hypothetical protein